jgi:integrase
VELPADPTGRRRRWTKGGFRSAKDAVDARAEVVRRHRAGTLPPDPTMTLGQWLPRWLATRTERGDLRESTAADYRDSIDRYLVPRLGHLRLVDLRAVHLTAAYDGMLRERRDDIAAAEATNVQRRAVAEARNRVTHSGRPRVPRLVRVARPLGPLTMRRIHNTLSGALRSAVRAGLISCNPATDAELPRATRPRVKVWTAQQLGAFLDATAGHRMHPFFHLAAFAGLRRGELCGLCWDDVDLDAGRITVRWQITHNSYRAAPAAQKVGRRAGLWSTPKSWAAGSGSSTSTRLIDVAE